MKNLIPYFNFEKDIEIRDKEPGVRRILKQGYYKSFQPDPVTREWNFKR